VTLNVKQGGLTTECCFPGRAFIDQMLIEQFLNQDPGDSAGYIHAARQFGARDGLMFMNYIQRNPAIDISGC